MRPRASIIIPTYNQRPDYLQAAIQSAVNQTVAVEIIIVDDGSERPVNLDDYAAAPNATIKLITHGHNKGIAAALNTGTDAMTTKWWTWLPSDDLFDKHKIERQLNAGGQASYHRYRAIDAEGRDCGVSPAPPVSKRALKTALKNYCCINGLCVMLHRDVIEAIGPFDEGLKYGQDWEYWCRVATRYDWQPMHDVLATRRRDGNLTSKIEKDPELRAIRDAEDNAIRAQYQDLLRG